jgi:hypothetical protein
MTASNECQKMRLWIQNLGLRGCNIAVATSEAAARSMMAAETWNYSEDAPLTAYDLDAGFKFVNVGDQ